MSLLVYNDSLFQDESGSGSIVELSEESLDYDYVAENILTNTDHFLASKISGQFKTWHLIFFTSIGTLVASRFVLSIMGVLGNY